MKFLLSYIFVFLILMTTACKSTKQRQSTTPATTVIAYKRAKARCMRCPDFSIEILNNRTAIYNGNRNVAVLGERIIPLSKKQYRQIITQFVESNFLDYDPLYLTRKRDLPRLILTYQGHKVNTQEEACPATLMQLMQLIESIKPK